MLIPFVLFSKTKVEVSLIPSKHSHTPYFSPHYDRTPNRNNTGQDRLNFGLQCQGIQSTVAGKAWWTVWFCLWQWDLEVSFQLDYNPWRSVPYNQAPPKVQKCPRIAPPDGDQKLKHGSPHGTFHGQTIITSLHKVWGWTGQSLHRRHCLQLLVFLLPQISP